MKKAKSNLLVVDDDIVTLELFSTILSGYGIENFILCQNSKDVLPILHKESISAVVLDLNMPEPSGYELLLMIKEDYNNVPVIVVTGEDKVDTAVDCMKKGAFDYLTKPVDKIRLVSVIQHATEIHELQKEVNLLSRKMLSGRLKRPEVFKTIITRSEIMNSIFKYIEAIADSNRPVLITGESGTGKELVAAVIHAISNSEGQFVPVNVAGLDDTIFSDTLFGHKRGSFTGAESERLGLIEHASGGTLFLDEIGELDMFSQVKLLRLLQEKTYYPLGSDFPKMSKARILTATNADIKQKVKEGSFRKDLYYRLISHNIHLPPLRERREDIPLLFDFFLDEAAASLNKAKPEVSRDIITLLTPYHFPGNVRELQTMVFDALSRHESGMLSIAVFKEYLKEQRGELLQEIDDNAGTFVDLNGESFPSLKQIEDRLFSEALKRSKGNQTIAAELLGISQSTLSRWLKNRRQN
ncbi:MAG: sigma-54 dependent transcriptional regulator [Spirochaetota bacterium]